MSKVKMNNELLEQVAKRVNELRLEKFDSEMPATLEDYTPSVKYQAGIAKIIKRKKKHRSFKTLKTTIAFAALITAALAYTLSTVSADMKLTNYANHFVAYPRHTDFNTVPKDGIDDGTRLNEILEYREPQYIPDGFELVDSFCLKETYEYRILYENESGEDIFYIQSTPSASCSEFNTDKSIHKEIVINGYTCDFFTNGVTHYIIWFDGDYSYFLCCKMDLDTTLKVAESVG